jgi:hypothetical protein
MKKFGLIMLATALASAPAQAAEWNDVRPGAFVGARLTIGGVTGSKASAALTIAPTQTRTSQSGFSSLRIGEGLALNLTPGAKPTLTLAGIRADTALGLHRNGTVDSDRELGVSTGGWIAIGVGAAVVVGAAVFYSAVTSCEEHDDEC